MATRRISVSAGESEVVLGLDETGDGPTVLLLPALSSISTRREMHPLMERLAADFRVVTVDWPGFGEAPRPKVDWTPDLMSAFLERILREEAARAHAIVAVGHAATYALHAVWRDSALTRRLVLVAPTWRGPFPTMLDGERGWLAGVRAALDSRVVGPALYALNVSRPVVAFMAREHVYSDPQWLSGERAFAKRAVTHAPGARHASVRFVTGALDRVGSRGAFLDLARRARVPILVVYGAETPTRSRAEIEALGDLPNVRLERLDKGRLALHEEFPDAVAALVAPFLDEGEET